MAGRGGGLTRFVLVALLCAATLPSFARSARAETFTVCPSGCEYTTIAAALAAADNGDTIAIGEGAYAGGIVVSKDVTLRGAGRDTTTIQGTSQASVIRVAARTSVTIRAVTITGGGGSTSGANVGGGGILNEGELSLIDSAVRENRAATGEGGGIFSSSIKTLRIRNSVISGNQATDGGGIFIRGGDVEIEESAITGNRSTRNGGGINHQGSGTLRLESVDVMDNRADMDVGGVSSSSELLLVDSTISGNSATNVGGLAGGRERLQVLRSTIRGNTSRGSGGGIRVGGGGAEIVRSTVEANRATSANGAGIFMPSTSGNISLQNAIVSGNIAGQDGGGILNDSAEIDLDHSKVIDNQAGRQGGGIYARTARKGALKLRNGSVVSGNQPDQCYPAALKC